MHQRMLQGLEKQLEHEERALQRTALLQAAWSERSRKESFLSEEENRKASERLQSLQTRRLQREKLLAERNDRSFEQEKERLVRAISAKFYVYYHLVSNCGAIWSICHFVSNIITSPGDTSMELLNVNFFFNMHTDQRWELNVSLSVIEVVLLHARNAFSQVII